MPSNSALIDQANKIAETKCIEINTDGLTNLELISLVSELKGAGNGDTLLQAGDLNDSEAVQVTDDDSGKEAEQITEPPVLENPVNVNSEALASCTTGGYIVAPGKAVTCKRGVVGEGEPVEVHHVGGGVDTLENLCQRGYLVKT